MAGFVIPLILSAVGGAISKGAEGQAKERGTQNDFRQAQDRTRSQNYGTQQGALLNSLLATGRDKLQGYGTKQGATTDAMQGLQGAWTSALGNESAEKIALAKLGLEAPTAAAKQSILGSLMKNVQPHKFASPTGQQGHLTTLSGGMGGAAIDPVMRQHGEALMQSALKNQLGGNVLPERTDFRSGIQDWSKSVLDTPEATDYSKGLLNPPDLGDYKDAGKLESILSLVGSGLNVAGGIAGGLNANKPPDYSDQYYGYGK